MQYCIPHHLLHTKLPLTSINTAYIGCRSEFVSNDKMSSDGMAYEGVKQILITIVTQQLTSN